jgi:hypothetical protein
LRWAAARCQPENLKCWALRAAKRRRAGM